MLLFWGSWRSRCRGIWGDRNRKPSHLNQRERRSVFSVLAIDKGTCVVEAEGEDDDDEGEGEAYEGADEVSAFSLFF